MKAYYEHERESNLKFDIVSPCCIIGAHFHSNLEVFLVKKGKYQITKNGVTKIISSGEIAVFDSYDVHSYDKRLEKECEDYVLLIPYRYLERINTFRQNKHIKSFIISNKELFDQLYQIMNDWMKGQTDDKITHGASELFLSVLIDYLEFDNVLFTEGVTIRKILNYIHQNFNNCITATEVAKNLGYSNAYVSRIFHKYLKESMPKYLNDMRLKYVENEIKKSNGKKISQIIFDAGFKSVQSYYRNKARKENK